MAKVYELINVTPLLTGSPLPAVYRLIELFFESVNNFFHVAGLSFFVTRVGDGA